MPARVSTTTTAPSNAPAPAGDDGTAIATLIASSTTAARRGPIGRCTARAHTTTMQSSTAHDSSDVAATRGMTPGCRNARTPGSMRAATAHERPPPAAGLLGAVRGRRASPRESADQHGRARARPPAPRPTPSAGSAARRRHQRQRAQRRHVEQPLDDGDGGGPRLRDARVPLQHPQAGHVAAAQRDDVVHRRGRQLRQPARQQPGRPAQQQAQAHGADAHHQRVQRHDRHQRPGARVAQGRGDDRAVHAPQRRTRMPPTTTAMRAASEAARRVVALIPGPASPGRRRGAGAAGRSRRCGGRP